MDSSFIFILQGTFTSLTRSDFLDDIEGGRIIQHNIHNIPIGYLWPKFKDNYIWLLNYIFL